MNITLPAGSQVTLLPGRTEAITIEAVTSRNAEPEKPTVIRLVDPRLDGVTLDINGAQYELIRGTALTISGPPMTLNA